MALRNVGPETVERGHRTHSQRSAVRAALRRGELPIAMVMREQPAAVADRTLFEILLLAHRIGRARLAVINARAMDDQINGAVRLKDADERARDWVTHNAQPRKRRASANIWAQLLQD
jgi:hypothetical protein